MRMYGVVYMCCCHWSFEGLAAERLQMVASHSEKAQAAEQVAIAQKGKTKRADVQNTEFSILNNRPMNLSVDIVVRRRRLP